MPTLLALRLLLTRATQSVSLCEVWSRYMQQCHPKHHFLKCCHVHPDAVYTICLSDPFHIDMQPGRNRVNKERVWTWFPSVSIRMTLRCNALHMSVKMALEIWQLGVFHHDVAMQVARSVSLDRVVHLLCQQISICLSLQLSPCSTIFNSLSHLITGFDPTGYQDQTRIVNLGWTQFRLAYISTCEPGSNLVLTRVN